MDFHDALRQREKEKINQYHAFICYLNSGVERNLTALASELSVSKATIFRWKSQFDWDARVSTIDAIVHGYIADQDFESDFQSVMAEINATARAYISLLRDHATGNKEKLSISDIAKASRALLHTMQIFNNTGWYGRVIEALKHLHNTENAKEASEAFVKEHLPKADQRTRDPDDEASL